jgi:hypothetical protein
MELTKFPPDIYKGFEPKEKKPLHKQVKKIVVKPALTADEIAALEGTHFNDAEKGKIHRHANGNIKVMIKNSSNKKSPYTIFDTDVDIYTIDNESGKEKLLAKLRKQVIDPAKVKIGWEGFWITAAPSRNRGAAAGPIDVKGKYWKGKNPTDINGWSAKYKLDGKTTSNMRVNNNVFSSVLGYFDATPFMKLPCRLTSYTARFWKYYKHGLPFIQAIDDCFRELVPDRYKLQRSAAEEKPLLHIPGTSFSSVTVNRNFRTALHKDAGDFKEGYGNLSVIERGKYQGGYTLFPQFHIGFNVRTGDFLAMDVHEWHTNTEMYELPDDKAFNKNLPRIHKDDLETGTLGAEKPYTRVSFVCYLRDKLRSCNNNETNEYFKKLGFNPKAMTLKKKEVHGKRVTRKKTE